MYLSENLQKKWEGVLDHPDLAPIKDPYRKAVTAVILENQAQEMMKGMDNGSGGLGSIMEIAKKMSSGLGGVPKS